MLEKATKHIGPGILLWAIAVSVPGCSGVDSSGKWWDIQSLEERRVASEAEADPFPTAEQALGTHGDNS